MNFFFKKRLRLCSVKFKTGGKVLEDPKRCTPAGADANWFRVHRKAACAWTKYVVGDLIRQVHCISRGRGN